MRPDKKKVIDEVWEDARVESFLTKGAFGAEDNVDFSALLHAYRSMRVDDFERFLAAFVAAGRDVNACNRKGETLLGVIAGHRRSAAFRKALMACGAVS
ncbi:MAG: PA4642 family protein [Pseudomonadota bacterium]